MFYDGFAIYFNKLQKIIQIMTKIIKIIITNISRNYRKLLDKKIYQYLVSKIQSK